MVLLLSFLLAGIPLDSAHAASDFERYLTAAIQLYENLDYELALEQLAQAKKVALGKEEHVTLALYEGIILADLNKWEEARASILTALLLEPEASLPVRVAPKTENMIEAQRVFARQEFDRRQRQEEPEPPSTPVEDNPSKAVATDRPERTSTPKTQLMPDTPPAPRELVQEVREPSRPVPVVPLALLGAGAVATLAGARFGLESRRLVDAAWGERTQFAVVSRLEEAQHSARTANILFGSAGVAVAGALVSWLLLPSPTKSPSGETR
ncbi:hypothetical protein [Archangium sp. Cb G35]|uniref:hypothetical protein n=1 Tax=Archangium sp. Cb G35 TaxID=1920190 RepID=UPI0009F844D3|nr:hypothetical protein [Archangium sp. Cb G35]